jgi:hypothetical protein
MAHRNIIIINKLIAEGVCVRVAGVMLFLIESGV